MVLSRAIMLDTMPIKRFTDYDPFAWTYNKHWGNVFTPVAFSVIEQMLLPKLGPEAKILDLCCGTGQLAAALSQQGYRVTGLDGSSRMLRFARKNAPTSTFILDDARSFLLRSRFDAVTCVFDSLNHIMSTDDLLSVFNSVNSALVDRGLFLLDFTTEANFIAHREGVYGIVESDHVCIQRSNYDTATKVGEYDFALFRLQHGEWRRSDFVLKQRSYEANEVLGLLKTAGFKAILVRGRDGEQGLKELSADSRRAFLLCAKVKQTKCGSGRRPARTTGALIKNPR
jgi:SAM-dependent methyltransferase